MAARNNPDEPTAPARILLVDDEPLVRQLGRELLESLGYKVEVAATGQEALTLVQTGERLDLVILDQHLPDLDGIEVLRSLKRLEPELPVLIASGLFTPNQAQMFLDSGAQALLTKPFRLAELAAQIRQVLGGTSRPRP